MKGHKTPTIDRVSRKLIEPGNGADGLCRVGGLANDPVCRGYRQVRECGSEIPLRNPRSVETGAGQRARPSGMQYSIPPASALTMTMAAQVPHSIM